jgi:hypothetical protein
MEINTAGRTLQIKVCRDSGGAVVFSSNLLPPATEVIFFMFINQWITA